MRADCPRSVFGLLIALAVSLAVAACDAPTEPSDEILVPAAPSYSLDPAAPTIHPLPDGDVFSVAWDLNDAGWVAGYLGSNEPYQAGVWIPEGGGPDSYRMLDLSALAGGYPGQDLDVNNHNDVAGFLTLPDGDTHVFVWSETKGFTSLEPAIPLLRYGYHACCASHDRMVLHASRRGTRSPQNREFVAHGR